MTANSEEWPLLHYITIIVINIAVVIGIIILLQKKEMKHCEFVIIKPLNGDIYSR